MTKVMMAIVCAATALASSGCVAPAADGDEDVGQASEAVLTNVCAINSEVNADDSFGVAAVSETRTKTQIDKTCGCLAQEKGSSAPNCRSSTHIQFEANDSATYSATVANWQKWNAAGTGFVALNQAECEESSLNLEVWQNVPGTNQWIGHSKTLKPQWLSGFCQPTTATSQEYVGGYTYRIFGLGTAGGINGFETVTIGAKPELPTIP